MHSLRRLGWRLGIDVTRVSSNPGLVRREVPVELDAAEQELTRWILDNRLTMGSPQRLYATALGIKYVMSMGYSGAFVECGVWRGGHSLLAAGMFALNGAPNNVYLFDTFAGMTAPTPEDVIAEDQSSALTVFQENQAEGHNEWCFAPLEEVRGNFQAQGLLSERVHFVKGPVEVSLRTASNLPSEICFLRLDTDFYASTAVELEVLYPLLTCGGVLALDDFGHWAGARQAVDEYFDSKGDRPLMNYVDYTCRIGQRTV